MTQPIIQMTLTRDELYLLEDLIPIWTEHADGFVFMLDNCTDGTYEFLMDNREKYNIHSVLQTGLDENEFRQEHTVRETLFKEARKFSSKITCLDTDEYFDGVWDKKFLHGVLDGNPDVCIFTNWLQYVDRDNVRVDGPWDNAMQDRLCNYTGDVAFKEKQRHAEHMPREGLETDQVKPPNFFISHLQWLDKPTVALKQYYWKVTDYVNNLKSGCDIAKVTDYDESVNDFKWETAKIPIPLKVSPEIYKKVNLEETYKYKEVKRLIKEYNVPNLCDWGMNIHE